MKISSLRKGMVFKRVGRWDDDSRNTSESPFHEVVDILIDEIDGGYQREVITLGNVSDKSTITVTMRNLSNLRNWSEVTGAAVVEKVEVITTTRKIRKIVFLHGTEEIISDYEVQEESQPVVLEKKKPKEKKAKKRKKKVVIVKPNLTVVSGEEIKRAAQHKEARDGQTNAITTALANLKAAVGVTPKNVSSSEEKNNEQVQGVIESGSLVYDSSFYWRLMRYTYQDLDILGAALEKCIPIFEDIFVVPKFKSRAVHQQELDKFRDGLVTLREIRAMGNRIKITTPDQLGTPVSPQQILKRMMRSFYHWGSVKEKEALGLNRKLSELPYGKQNQKRIQGKIDAANKKSSKFRRDLRNT